MSGKRDKPDTPQGPFSADGTLDVDEWDQEFDSVVTQAHADELASFAEGTEAQVDAPSEDVPRKGPPPPPPPRGKRASRAVSEHDAPTREMKTLTPLEERGLGEFDEFGGEKTRGVEPEMMAKLAAVDPHAEGPRHPRVVAREEAEGAADEETDPFGPLGVSATNQGTAIQEDGVVRYSFSEAPKTPDPEFSHLPDPTLWDEEFAIDFASWDVGEDERVTVLCPEAEEEQAFWERELSPCSDATKTVRHHLAAARGAEAAGEWDAAAAHYEEVLSTGVAAGAARSGQRRAWAESQKIDALFDSVAKEAEDATGDERTTWQHYARDLSQAMGRDSQEPAWDRADGLGPTALARIEWLLAAGRTADAFDLLHGFLDSCPDAEMRGAENRMTRSVADVRLLEASLGERARGVHRWFCAYLAGEMPPASDLEAACTEPALVCCVAAMLAGNGANDEATRFLAALPSASEEGTLESPSSATYRLLKSSESGAEELLRAWQGQPEDPWLGRALLDRLGALGKAVSLEPAERLANGDAYPGEPAAECVWRAVRAAPHGSTGALLDAWAGLLEQPDATWWMPEHVLGTPGAMALSRRQLALVGEQRGADAAMSMAISGDEMELPWPDDVQSGVRMGARVQLAWGAQKAREELAAWSELAGKTQTGTLASWLRFRAAAWFAALGDMDASIRSADGLAWDTTWCTDSPENNPYARARSVSAEEAVPLYQELLAKDEDDVRALRGLWLAARAAGDGEAEARVVRQWLMDDPECPGLHAALAEAVDRAGDDPSANYRELAPRHPWAQHWLERRALECGNWDELKALWNARAKKAVGRGRHWLAREWARQEDAASPEGQAAYRSVLEMWPTCRLALADLDAEKAQGRSAWFEQIAMQFVRDAKSRAAFLAQAARTAAAADEFERACSLFKKADKTIACRPYFLLQWRDAALLAGKLEEAAEASVARAETLTGVERAADLHFAAVLFLDHLEAPERGWPCLEEVLTLDSEHNDAFARLLQRSDADEQTVLSLIERRLDTTEDPAMQVALHMELARREKQAGATDKARLLLRRVVDLDPGNRRVIRELADLALKEERWDDAREMLERASEQEVDPRALKDVLRQLGELYADRLGDAAAAAKAFERVLSYDSTDETALGRLVDLQIDTGSWKRAYINCTTLLNLPADGPKRCRHWLRMARIHSGGRFDAQRAERAFKEALEADPCSREAVDALVDFFDRKKDPEGARIQLDWVVHQMRAKIAESAADPAPFAMLAHAMHHRHGLGAKGAEVLRRTAAQLALALGSEGAELSEWATPQDKDLRLVELWRREFEDHVYPASTPHELWTLLDRLGGRIAKYLGRELEDHGVGRDDLLRDREHPLLAVVLNTAKAMCVSEPNVYLNQTYPVDIAIEPTQPASLVVGSALASELNEAALRFVAARALFSVRTGGSIPGRMDLEEFTVFLAAVLEQCWADVSHLGLAGADISKEQARLRKLVPGNLEGDLAPFARVVANPDLPLDGMWRGIVQAANRAGALACGDVGQALLVLAKNGGYTTGREAAADTTIGDMLAFATSDAFAELSAAMGE